MQPRVRNIAKAVGTTYSVQAGSSQHTPAHCTSVAPVAINNALDVFRFKPKGSFSGLYICVHCTFRCVFCCWVSRVLCKCFRGGARSVGEVLADNAEVLQRLRTADFKPCSSVIVIDAWSFLASHGDSQHTTILRESHWWISAQLYPQR